MYQWRTGAGPDMRACPETFESNGAFYEAMERGDDELSVNQQKFQKSQVKFKSFIWAKDQGNILDLTLIRHPACVPARHSASA